MKYRKIIFVMCIIIFFIVILCRPFIEEKVAIADKGLDFFRDSKGYSFEYNKKNNVENCILKLDFENPEESVGTVLYERNGSAITVSEIIEKTDTDVVISFVASGDYDFVKGEGYFISPIIFVDTQDHRWDMQEGKMKVSPEDIYICRYSGVTNAFNGLTNEFIVRISRENWREELKDEDRQVLLQFYELGEINWCRE